MFWRVVQLVDEAGAGFHQQSVTGFDTNAAQSTLDALAVTRDGQHHRAITLAELGVTQGAADRLAVGGDHRFDQPALGPALQNRRLLLGADRRHQAADRQQVLDGIGVAREHESVVPRQWFFAGYGR